MDFHLSKARPQGQWRIANLSTRRGPLHTRVSSAWKSTVFRSLHGFKRLILRNLGLTHHQGRGVRYSMYMGVDVADGLDSAKSQSRIKNNIFATGFLDGVPASRGCSAKGKFWSSAKVHDL